MTRSAVLVRVAVIIGALALGTLLEWVAGASAPGRMPVFALGSAFLLVLGAKRFGAIVSRPVGTRAGELGDPVDGSAPDPDPVGSSSGGAAGNVVSRQQGVDEGA